MPPSPIELRRSVAAKALAYKNGEISWDACMGEFGELADSDQTDDLIADLISVIEHEPQRGGLLGLNERQWKDYEQHIYRLIDELNK